MVANMRCAWDFEEGIRPQTQQHQWWGMPTVSSVSLTLIVEDDLQCHLPDSFHDS